MQSGATQLLAWIRRRGFSQREAAEYLGWEETFISKLVNGERTPGLTNAVKIEDLTGIPTKAWVSSRVDKEESERVSVRQKRAS